MIPEHARMRIFSWFSNLFGPGLPEIRYQPVGTWHSVPPDAKAVGEFRTKVVGVRFKNPDGTSRQQAIRSVHPGMPLRLFFEDNNPKDPDAVAVYAGDAQIGYLNAELAAEVRRRASREDFTDLTAYRVTDDVWNDGKRHLGVILGCGLNRTNRAER